jgi:hypothetical protein
VVTAARAMWMSMIGGVCSWSLRRRAAIGQSLNWRKTTWARHCCPRFSAGWQWAGDGISCSRCGGNTRVCRRSRRHNQTRDRMHPGPVQTQRAWAQSPKDLTPIRAEFYTHRTLQTDVQNKEQYVWIR